MEIFTPTETIVEKQGMQIDLRWELLVIFKNYIIKSIIMKKIAMKNKFFKFFTTPPPPI